MRIQDAKQILCEDILSHFGTQVVKTRVDPTHGLQLLCKSPFREDSEPSLVVTVSKNIYFDNGMAHVDKSDPRWSGNAVDLLSAFIGNKIKGQMIRETLSEFSRRGFASVNLRSTNISSQNQKSTHTKSATGKEKERSPSASLELVDKKGLFSYVLKNYLKDERKISLDIAVHHVWEIRYRKPGVKQTYFGIGFPAGNGYETTSGGTKGQKRFKGFVGTSKDITVIDRKTSQCLVFSGFIDFLTHLTEKGLQRPKCSCVILHSDHLSQKGIDWILSQELISSIYYFRDRDEIKPAEQGKQPNLSGLKSFQAFETQLLGKKVIDVSEQKYQNYVDLNDWWIDKLP